MWRLAAVYVLLWCVVLWWVLLGCVLLWCDVVLRYAVLYGRRNLTKNPSLKLSGKIRVSFFQVFSMRIRCPMDHRPRPLAPACAAVLGVCCPSVEAASETAWSPVSATED